MGKSIDYHYYILLFYIRMGLISIFRREEKEIIEKDDQSDKDKSEIKEISTPDEITLEKELGFEFGSETSKEEVKEGNFG